VAGALAYRAAPTAMWARAEILMARKRPKPDQGFISSCLAPRRSMSETVAMSVWSQIADRAGRAFDPGAEPPEFGEECAPLANDVGFTAAVIGLAAKMARADGEATEAELRAAAQVFRPQPGEEAAFRRVFSLAKQTVLGFDSYARQIGKKYQARPCLLEDVLDGLFHIAAADGAPGEAELAYLEEVASHFGFSDLEFRRIKATNLGPDAGDPYAILGLLPGATMEEVRHAWRRAAAENHPDRMIQRGAPPEFVAIAREKTAAINAAYTRIRDELSIGAK
jgi:DnaJ like chaperone protein